MAITQDTQIMISLWTLVACWLFLWRLSANISTFKKEVEMELQDHNERLKKIEDLDIKSILTEMKTNIERIKKKMEEKH